ncbi:MAG: helix-turn-helix transcriptional regulator [Nitrospirae bacterium]|nr:helix-turn-helix transcriptional regulator [Nitrospirota bacterium]
MFFPPMIAFSKLLLISRRVQGISQAHIADSIGVSQAAIAQYESGKNSLSMGYLKKMAPFLNLDPGYLDNTSYNPFRQADMTCPIKIILPENIKRDIDYEIINIIANHNLKVNFIFFRISDEPIEYARRIWRQKRNGYTACAFAIKDTENNIFVARRKRNFAFFNENEVEKKLMDIKYHQNINSYMKSSAHFFIKSVDIPLKLFNQILDWQDIDCNLLLPLFETMESNENIEYLKKLVNLVWSHPEHRGRLNEKEYILYEIEKIGAEYYSRSMGGLLHHVMDAIRQYTIPYRLGD